MLSANACSLTTSETAPGVSARFDCVLDDGTAYPSDPGYSWMNWATASLAPAGALLAIGAGYVTEFRARKDAR